MSFVRNAKEFFGLAPTNMEHDDAYFDEEPRYETHGSAAYAPATRGYDDSDYDRADRADRAARVDRIERPERAERYAAPAPREERSFAPTVVSVELTTYNQATEIGGPFRDGDAVVFDLTRMENGENKRIIDFAAGLCFALRGRMVNVTKHLDTDRVVFAIVPETSDIPQIDLERAAKLR